jgi:hypothetical protein
VKVADLIKELEGVREEHGNIKVQLQSNPADTFKGVVDSLEIFVVPERYDSEWVCNIRAWPY